MPEEWLAEMKKSRPMETPIATLNELLQAGKREEALDLLDDVLKENPGELPLTAVAAQLHASFRNGEKARDLFKGVMERLALYVDDGMVEAKDAAFGFFRLALSISNAGIEAQQAIDLALKYEPGFFHARLTREVVSTLLRTGQLDLAMRLLERGERYSKDNLEVNLEGTQPAAGQWKKWVSKLKIAASASDQQEALKGLSEEIKTTSLHDTVSVKQSERERK